MLEIRNITRGTTTEREIAFTTRSSGYVGYPNYVDLLPGATLVLAKQNLRDWQPGVKQELAQYVAHGFLEVTALDSSHLFEDLGHNCDFGYDDILPATDGLALTRALEVAVSLDTAINGHVASTAVHNAATAAIAVAAPTDLASLLLWIAAAQTAYDTTHRPSVAAHPHVDANNIFVPVVAADLATAIAALRELITAYTAHKTWYVGTAKLDVPTIMTY